MMKDAESGWLGQMIAVRSILTCFREIRNVHAVLRSALSIGPAGSWPEDRGVAADTTVSLEISTANQEIEFTSRKEAQPRCHLPTNLRHR